MYNILLSTSPDFSVKVSNIVPDYGWGFNPPTILDVVSFIGQSNPSNIDVATKIKNYIFLFGDQFNEYYLKLDVVHPVLNGNVVEWLTVSGVIEAATGNGYLLTTGNLNVVTTFAFNVVNIPRGASDTRLDFKVYGKNLNTPVQHIESYIYHVKLRRLIGTDIFITPSDTIVWTHLVGQPLPGAVQRTVNTLDSFTVEVAEHITLSGGNLVFVDDINGIKTYTGSGIQTIDFKLEVSIESEENTDPYYYADVVFTTSSGAFFVQQLGVKVYDAVDNIVTPSFMEFFAVKDLQEAEEQELVLEGYGAFTITGPSWLVITPSSGNNNTTVFVKPINSSSLSLGTYNSVIRVIFFGLEHIIPVTHIVVDRLNIGISIDKINFTKDHKTITDLYGSNDTVAEISLSNVSYGYGVQRTTEGSGSFKRGIFNNRTDFFLGNVVEKFMPILKGVSLIGLQGGLTEGSGNTLLPFSLYKYYNPSVNTVIFRFRDNILGEYIFTKQVNNIRFIKGRKPSRFKGPFGIIDYNESPIRVTPNGFTILNLYRSDSISRIQIFRNGTAYTSIFPDRQDSELFGVLFNFKKFSPGDLIEVKISNSSRTEEIIFSQKYIVFPEGKESYHIGWEDEHGLLSIFEFTGDIEIPKKFEAILSKKSKRYLESTKKSGSNNELSLKANTGWIIKSNQSRIDSLCNAKIAWLISSEGKKEIELIPITKNLPMEENDRELYEYTLEFKINPQHELENYTL